MINQQGYNPKVRPVEFFIRGIRLRFTGEDVTKKTIQQIREDIQQTQEYAAIYQRNTDEASQVIAQNFLNKMEAYRAVYNEIKAKAMLFGEKLDDL